MTIYPDHIFLSVKTQHQYEPYMARGSILGTLLTTCPLLCRTGPLLLLAAPPQHQPPGSGGEEAYKPELLPGSFWTTFLHSGESGNTAIHRHWVRHSVAVAGLQLAASFPVGTDWRTRWGIGGLGGGVSGQPIETIYVRGRHGGGSSACPHRRKEVDILHLSPFLPLLLAKWY